MSLVLLRPAALASAVAIAAIVLLHMIQSRWRHRVVPSLVIWRRVLARGLAVRARRPSVDLPLLLAVAAASLLVVAGGEPELLSVGRAGRDLVVVIDNGTASLTESRPGPTRFAESVRRARRLLAALSAGDRATLVATSPEAHVLASSDDPDEVARRLEGLSPVQVTGSVESAVALALAQRTGLGPVVAFASRATGVRPQHVRLERVGSPSQNVAITHADFSAEEAFCAVRNYSAREAIVRVSLSDSGAEVRRELARQELTVAAGGRSELVFAPRGRALEDYARATAVSLDLGYEEDDLDADNSALAGPSSSRALRIGLVGTPGAAVARALRAARAETVVLAETDGTYRQAVDCVIYTSTAPREWPPPRPALLVAPERSTGPVRMLGEEMRDVRAQFLVGAGAAGPRMLRGFPPVELRVSRAARAALLAPHTPLIATSGGEGEILAAGIREGPLLHVYLGFLPEDSDWPQRASFPVFVQRALESLGAGGAARGSFAFARVGESAARHLPAGVRVVKLPGGTEQPAEARLLVGGLYRFRPQDERDGPPSGTGPPGLLAVNLLSEDESDNRLTVPGAPQAEEAGPGEADVEAEAAEASRAGRLDAHGLAGVLSAFGLCLLAAEWLASARRA